MPFVEELKVIAFIAGIWLIECIMAHAGSELIGNVLTGIIMGPALLDMVPYEEAFRLLGKIGVLLLVIESGSEVDIKMVQKIGLRAFAAALTGVALPVALALLVYSAGFNNGWKISMAVGAAIAPTSLGFSAKLLNEYGQLKSTFGQIVCTAAVMDDVISLALLGVINALGQDDASNWEIIAPVIASLSSIVIGVFLTWSLPKQLEQIFQMFPPKWYPSLQLFGVFALSTLFSWVCALVGSSELLGCFFAGLIFSQFTELKLLWKQHISIIQIWLVRLFFAATIGFSVPELFASGGLFTASATGRGLLLTACTILGKLSVGLFAQPLTYSSFLKLGWAMEGRGEFSFLIADQAHQTDLLTSSDFSAVIWALLITCTVAPFIFKRILKQEHQEIQDSAHAEEVNTRHSDDDEGIDLYGISSRPHMGSVFDNQDAVALDAKCGNKDQWSYDTNSVLQQLELMTDKTEG